MEAASAQLQHIYHESRTPALHTDAIFCAQEGKSNFQGMHFMQALELKGVSPEGSDLIRHNLVVFREGQGALQVWAHP